MAIALLTFALMGTLALLGSIVVGYEVPAQVTALRPHFLLGLLSTTLLVMAHSFIMFFLIATGVEKVIFSIYGSSKLSKIEDLKGKKLGVTQLGASTDFVGRYVLRQAKLEPEKDVAILQMGGQPEIIAGLQGGSIDAGVLAPPITTQARKAGFKQLADLADYDLVFYQGPLDAKKSWLKEHPAEALNVVRGYLDGIATVNKDKQTAIQAISKYTKLTDAEALEEGYQAVVKSLPKVPLPKVDAIKTGLAENKSPAAKTADPASFIEPSLVDQLQKSGFIDSLYK